MLCGKGARGSDTFDIDEQQAPGGKRNDTLDISEAKRWTFQRRQPGRDLPGRRHPQCGKPKCDRYGNRQRHSGKGHWPARQKAIAQQEQQNDREAHGQYEEVCLAKLARPHDRSLEEVMAAACNTEQAWQLCHDDRQSGPSLEANQNAVADEPH